MPHVSVPLRAVARVIYEAVYPSEEWAPVGFDDAERFETVHYQQVITAAERAHARLMVADKIGQL
jgi:hypothetical protein